MARRPTNPGSIPRLRKRLRPGGRVYYYYDAGDKPRREIALGSDYGAAIVEYARLEKSRAASALVEAVLTFEYVAAKYMEEVVPTKSSTTQKDNTRELKQLLIFFNDPPGPLEAIEPKHVVQYLRYRSKTAKVRANREKALLSAIWNFARQSGYTSLANPCAGIKGNKETGRDTYVEDEMFAAVYLHADQPLKDALDLFYLTAQRIGDTLKMDERDLLDNQLLIKQGKTSAKRRIEVVGELKVVIERILERKKGHKIRSTRLVVMDNGQAMTTSMLRGRFDAARMKAGIEKSAFQMRDLRAKAATDKEESTGSIRDARDQLGHTTVGMTEQYIRRRKGLKVLPTK
ncbi:tyrosine-type recombinase/integrase [Pseudomonas sp. PA-1-2A]|uniref:tyrosine-type recombinase/integrase n=1 Tax=Pseudomonas TaxID=286 RepID=UPI001474611C|nr:MULTISPECIES: tyrosine-type recombinase/integrase [Pseudomonas]MCF5691097.1 tyrosine-type recombinase/integrase [Pseudomonas sp. PA-1-8C]MCF5788691.1 tyrosine-type recombinase/integrase [Pseudomonas sp. PA-1-6G]MCF5791497.1 tyrosine-type recombinase/integrase [Pseudomonas sp. PA-1-6B]MCF5800484.1 tyrosine-type recombinase/integrase [Pseudomonas sp. PA-1-5A]MCF5814031.1 tyrosine-type recombinase/integrase [Pseudomonas sp. PA-1-2A]